MSQCRACGDEIVWGVTPDGHYVAVDVAPVAGGTYVLYDLCRGEPPFAIRAARHDALDDRYAPHVGTCGDAGIRWGVEPCAGCGVAMPYPAPACHACLSALPHRDRDRLLTAWRTRPRDHGEYQAALSHAHEMWGYLRPGESDR